MRLRLLALCLGIALHSRSSELPLLLLNNYQSASRLVMVLSVLLLLLAIALFNPQNRLLKAVSYAGLFGAGFFWAMALAQHQMHHRLPVSLESQDFWLIGQVASLVRAPPATQAAAADSFNRRTSQFEFVVQSACLRLLPEQCEAGNRLMKGMRVSLSDYAGLPVSTGERWQLRVRVNRPHGFSNPGASDFEAAQFQRGIMARGYIRETTFNKRLAEASPSVNKTRAALATHI